MNVGKMRANRAYGEQRRTKASRSCIAAVLVAMTVVGGWSSASADAACPNEAVRTGPSVGLPDCRAYELVTPPFKYGEPATSPFDGIGANGGSILFSDVGAFGEAGNNSTALGVGYIAQRTGGWVSEPTSASAAQFRGYSQGVVDADDANVDLSATVFDRAPVDAKPIDDRFYIRQAGGTTTEVGPITAPARVATWTQAEGEEGNVPFALYAGASPDLSHLLFSVLREGPSSFLWPGDTTVGYSSLYEYTGSGHTGVGSDVPALVGVNDAGHLISQCGTTLGGPNTENKSVDVYNAISAESEAEEPGVAREEAARVFFTAPRGGCAGNGPDGEPTVGEGPQLNELFVRINGSETVAISEPSHEDCAECNTAEAKGPLTEEQANALVPTFQGASRDGAKVFFISKQKLLPGANGLNLYEYDFDAANPHEKVSLVAPDLPETSEFITAVAQGGVMRVSENGSRVYFVSLTDELATNDDSLGSPAKEGDYNMYVYNTETKQTVFVADLAEADKADWSVEDLRQVDATPEGEYVVFASVDDLTKDASGNATQIYRYDAPAGEANAVAEEHGGSASATSLVRVTAGEDGFNDNGNGPASLVEIGRPEYAGADRAVNQGASVSDDGARVFFASSAALTPAALNNVCALEVGGECEAPALNVYEYEGGQVYLISDGRDSHAVLANSAVDLLGASASGDDVFFTTADQLVGADTDTQSDIYDARVDGGIVEPAVSHCEGGSCQGVFTTAPSLASPASMALAGDDNLPAAAPVVAPPKTAAQIRAEKLAKALKTCRAKRKKTKRKSCEALARKRYGPPKAKKSQKKGSRS